LFFARANGATMSRKKVSTTVYITPEQSEKLKQLNQKTKVPIAEYIREGIDLVLERHKNQIPGQMSFEQK
jgi:hypothetical protein